MEKIIARGAEALLIRKNDKLIKKRIRKGYRIKEIDEKLRKSRTRSEAKLIQKTSFLIPVPSILKVDEEKKEIIMNFVEGKRLCDCLDRFSLKKAKKICEEIGKNIASLHNSNIIHGDLTTSNMILKKKVYFIDFGLGFFSGRVEDKAVDLHLLRQALEAKHFERWKKYFSAVISAYDAREKEKILCQLKKVEARGRYKRKKK